MGSLIDTLFGDKGKGAAKQQTKQNEQERQFIMQQTQQAQNLLQQMYPTMQQNSMLGGQAALTTMRNSLPQAAQARQQGTQNSIAAILGGQGRQIQPNFGFIPQQIPNYQAYSAPINNQQQFQRQNWQAPNNLSEADSRALSEIMSRSSR